MPIPKYKQKEFFIEKPDLSFDQNENIALISTENREMRFFINNISLDIPVSQNDYDPSHQQSERYNKRSKIFRGIFSFATKIIRIISSLRT